MKICENDCCWCVSVPKPKKTLKLKSQKAMSMFDVSYHLWRRVSENERTRLQGSLKHVKHIRILCVYSKCVYIYIQYLKCVLYIRRYSDKYVLYIQYSVSNIQPVTILQISFQRQFATVKTVVGDALRRFNRPAIGDGLSFQQLAAFQIVSASKWIVADVGKKSS